MRLSAGAPPASGPRRPRGGPGLEFGASPRASVLRDLASLTVAQLDDLAVRFRAGEIGRMSPADAALVATFAEQTSHAACWRARGRVTRAEMHTAAANAALSDLSKGVTW